MDYFPCRLTSRGIAITFFFPRARGEPSRSRKSDCTRLNMRSRSVEVTWETISCEDMKAEVGVCEYPMGNITRNKTCSLQGGQQCIVLNGAYLLRSYSYKPHFTPL